MSLNPECRGLRVSRGDDEIQIVEEDDQSAGWAVWAWYVTTICWPRNFVVFFYCLWVEHEPTDYSVTVALLRQFN